MRTMRMMWCCCIFLFLAMAIMGGSAVFSQGLLVKIGDKRAAVIANMGSPKKSKRFDPGKERLFYDDLMVDVVDGRVDGIRSAKGFKGMVFSVRVGDTPEQVRRSLGKPDEAGEGQLVYYDYKGNYISFSLDGKRKVRDFYLREGVSGEDMEKQRKMIAELVKEGEITSDEELAERIEDKKPSREKRRPAKPQKGASPDEARIEALRKRLAHDHATKKDYKKYKREARRRGGETIEGLLKDKSPRFWPVEEKHGLDKKMYKFSIEYDTVEDGKKARAMQECYIDRFSPYLKKKLDDLSAGDSITIQGQWKVIEKKERDERDDVEIEQRMSMSIFVVDRIEKK